MTEQQRAFIARKPVAPPEDFAKPPEEAAGDMPKLSAVLEQEAREVEGTIRDVGQSKSGGRAARLSRRRE